MPDEKKEPRNIIAEWQARYAQEEQRRQEKDRAAKRAGIARAAVPKPEPTGKKNYDDEVLACWDEKAADT